MKYNSWIILLLVAGYALAEDKWSWGENRRRKAKNIPVSKVVFEDDDSSITFVKSPPVKIQDEDELTAKSSERHARKIETSISDKKDGKTEPRFFGLKKKLCKHGIGLHCPSGYDLLEIHEPYAAQAVPYPVHHGYGSGDHYGGSVINPQHVLKVQPVALQPVGSPIQAVPVGPGGGGYGGGLGHGGGIGYGGGIGHGSGGGLALGGGIGHAGGIGHGSGYGSGGGLALGGGIGHGSGYGSGGGISLGAGIGHAGGYGGGVEVTGGYGGGGIAVGPAVGGGYGAAGVGIGGGVHHGGGIGIGSQGGGYGASVHDISSGYGAPAHLPVHSPAPSYGPFIEPVHGSEHHVSGPTFSHDPHVKEIDFGSSIPTYDPNPSFEEIPIRESVYDEPQIVKHFHTHTHIHKGDRAPRDGFESDYSYSGSHVSSSVDSRPPKRHILPIIEPRPSGLSPFYRENCECVPNYFCPSSNVVARSSGHPLLDARNKPSKILSTAAQDDQLTSAASEVKEIEVEAPNPKKKTKREIRTTFRVLNATDSEGRQAQGKYRTRNRNGQLGCASGEVCCRSDGFAGRKLSYKCGRKNSPSVLGRVSNSKYTFQAGDTQFGEYPWQGAILKRENSQVIYVCGAALANFNHVLTAAHCVNGMDPHELKVRLGEWDVNRKTEFYDYVESDVEEIIIHPQFYSGTLTNDIAILTLKDAVDFQTNPHINPVCLPHSRSDFSNRQCHVTGWGKDAFGSEGNFQFVLKAVKVPIWGNKGCESSLKRTRLGRSYKLDDGMLCAGGEEGKDACKGDGGGPLVCEADDGSMELAGLVSWGIGCGERGVPGVYVNVPFYMEWITRILQTT